jgi:hypothetical protein
VAAVTEEQHQQNRNSNPIGCAVIEAMSGNRSVPEVIS